MLDFDSEDIDGMDDDAGDIQEPAVGERSNFKKIPTCTQDHGDGIAMRGESVVESALCRLEGGE